MNETAILPPTSNVRRNVQRQFKNVEAFEAWLDEQEFSYELVNQKAVEKPPISQAELMLIWWLTEFFKKTEAHLKRAILVGRVGMPVATGNFRIPDLAFFTAGQCFDAAKGKRVIPDLAIEILSKSETVEEVAEKLKDYFASGVRVVWYIYPKTEQIYVYTSTKNVVICAGEDVCSAAPALPDYEFPAAAIFRKER